MNISQNLKWTIAAIGCAIFLGFIIYMANFHHDSIIFYWLGFIPWADKILHFTLIGGLALVLNKALNAKRVTVFKFRFLLGSIIIGVLALGEELSQAFIPSRNLDVVDLIFDYVGIWFFSRRIQKKSIHPDAL